MQKMQKRGLAFQKRGAWIEFNLNKICNFCNDCDIDGSIDVDGYRKDKKYVFDYGFPVLCLRGTG